MRKLFALFALLSSTLPIAIAQEVDGPRQQSMVEFIFPFVIMGVVFYFLLIRPSNQRQKKHKAMIEAVKKGDEVVTSGGLVGKVTKVTDAEVTVELAKDVRVKAIKGMLADVRPKGAPAPANDTK
ncbi:MAG: preprotein translocase subunit YajC [Pseudomonadota bacterium]